MVSSPNNPRKSKGLTLNMCLAIGFYAIFGIYSEIQILVFGTMAKPLNRMFNDSLFMHYGIQAGAKGLASVSSLISFLVFLGVTLSIIFVLPQLDKRGRKFITVHFRFCMGLTIGLCQFLSALTGFAEFFIISQFFIGMQMPIYMITVLIYLSECSPDSCRGLVVTLYQCVSLVGSLLMFYLGKPSVWGSDDKWGWIPAITLILSIACFLTTVFLPESPRWLVARGREDEARRSIRFYQGVEEEDADRVLLECRNEVHLFVQEKISPRELLTDPSLRLALLIIVAILFNLHSLSPAAPETMYTVTIHTQLGLTVEQSMQMNFFIHLVFGPLRFLGTFLIDRFGRRFVYFVAFFLTYSKVISLVVAYCIVYFSAPTRVTVWLATLNEVLSELINATGVQALSGLLITELFPPAARVSAAQITFFISFFASFPILAPYPILNAWFPPGFYIFLLVIHPLFVVFLYKYLPETAAKSVCEIVHDLDEKVSTSRRQSQMTERSGLLSKRHSTQSYTNSK